MPSGQDICARTFRFAERIVRVCQSLDGKSDAARVLGRQLLRAGTSIGANVEEAQLGHSRADFVHKCSIAAKEARETHYWLRLLVSTEMVPKAKLQDMIDECDQLVAILTSIIKNTKQNSP